MKEEFKVIEQVTLASDFTSLIGVENIIDTISSSLELQEEFYGNVLIAVTEAVNNAIDHGNKKDATKSVILIVGTTDESICFSIVDEGEGFDFNNLPDPTAPENILKENGRGIFLMQNLADEMEFENDGRKVNIYFNR
jgi:serine/threonine-protein kinase RsbW